MSSVDQLDVLRERYMDLLKQLKRQREKMLELSCFNRKRGREKEEREESVEPVQDLIRTEGDPGPARAALRKLAVTFADTSAVQADAAPTPNLTSSHSGANAQQTAPSDILDHRSRPPEVNDGQQDSRSCLVNQGKEQRETRSRVSFHPDKWEEMPADRHHLRSLLGYDWIAGVLDVESSVTEHSDDFYNDLRTFRSLNRDECVHSPQAEFVQGNSSFLPLLTDKDNTEANVETHQCTFNYVINSRLFPVPLQSQECCPLCETPKSSCPHTPAEPALIRVGVPRSVLTPAYQYKAHRRRSFDPSDSLGLPSHCMTGWVNTSLGNVTEPRPLDLRSSLHVKKPCEVPLPDSQNLSASKVSGNQRSGQSVEVPVLNRHIFQHCCPKRKASTSTRT
ncbi:migration and invasion inhibitory protein [Genypterus blacodes]|uniref:migration and invasion inhibitory protein n=1 Tax=Genypterus blacodes TaxID=154954 RepID=UPI003F75F7F2